MGSAWAEAAVLPRTTHPGVPWASPLRGLNGTGGSARCDAGWGAGGSEGIEAERTENQDRRDHLLRYRFAPPAARAAQTAEGGARARGSANERRGRRSLGLSRSPGSAGSVVSPERGRSRSPSERASERSQPAQLPLQHPEPGIAGVREVSVGALCRRQHIARGRKVSDNRNARAELERVLRCLKIAAQTLSGERGTILDFSREEKSKR